MSSKSILVVDDDFDLRQNIVQALKMENYIVHEATNGQEALDFLEHHAEAQDIGCIVLDLMMPIMDGKVFLDVLEKKYPKTHAKIPIIVATAKGSPIRPEVVEHAVARIQKPMDLDELYRVVHEHCGSSKKD